MYNMNEYLNKELIIYQPKTMVESITPTIGFNLDNLVVFAPEKKDLEVLLPKTEAYVRACSCQRCGKC